MHALYVGLDGDPRAAMVWDALMRVCLRSRVLGWVRGAYGDNIRKGQIADYDIYVRVGAFRDDGVRYVTN